MFCELSISCLFIIFHLNPILADFDYKNTDSWSVQYAECCGRMQSPIDIDLNTAQYHWYGDRLTFYNYEELPKMAKLSNDGHTLKIDFDWESPFIPHISGGPLNTFYQFHSLHFHWNTNQQSGSEHRVNGESFPLEAHMVHFNSMYNSYSNALKYRDGLAVVSVLFALSMDDRSIFLSRILANASEVMQPEVQTNIQPFRLQLLLNEGMLQDYAVYYGSLTTPPCTEGVTWFVSLRPLPVSMAELNMFRDLKLMNDDDHNNRPIQPRNARFPPKPENVTLLAGTVNWSRNYPLKEGDFRQQSQFMPIVRASNMETGKEFSGIAGPLTQVFDFISVLPTEMSQAIFRRLNPQSLLNAARVSKKWHSVCESDSRLKKTARRHIRKEKRRLYDFVARICGNTTKKRYASRKILSATSVQCSFRYNISVPASSHRVDRQIRSSRGIVSKKSSD